MDSQRRELERRAQAGDLEADARLKHVLTQMGESPYGALASALAAVLEKRERLQAEWTRMMATGYVYAPYIPLHVTPTMLIDGALPKGWTKRMVRFDGPPIARIGEGESDGT